MKVMEGWNYWLERKVFIILKNKRQYSGVVIGIDIKSTPIIFITIIDKFQNRITFTHSEIELIQEEKE